MVTARPTSAFALTTLVALTALALLSEPAKAACGDFTSCDSEDWTKCTEVASVTMQGSVSCLKHVKRVTGDLETGSTDVPIDRWDLSGLESLAEVGGSVRLSGGVLSNLKALHGLKSIGSTFEIGGTLAAGEPTNVLFPSLASLPGEFGYVDVYELDGAKSVEFGALSTARGVEVRHCLDLEVVSLPVLERTNWLQIEDNPFLTSVCLCSAKRVDGFNGFSKNPRLNCTALAERLEPILADPDSLECPAEQPHVRADTCAVVCQGRSPVSTGGSGNTTSSGTGPGGVFGVFVLGVAVGAVAVLAFKRYQAGKRRQAGNWSDEPEVRGDRVELSGEFVDDSESA